MMYKTEQEAEVELKQLQAEFVNEYCPVRRAQCLGPGDGTLTLKCKCYYPGRIDHHPNTHPQTPWVICGPNCYSPLITGEISATT